MQLFSPHIGILFWTIVAIPGILFLIVAMNSLIRSEVNSSNKILWAIIIILVPLFGPLFYFVVGRPQNAREK
jgi:hypothetical protein